MKKQLAAGIIFLCLIGYAFTLQGAVGGQTGNTEQLSPLTPDLVAIDFDQLNSSRGSYYPSCFAVQGTSCAPPGAQQLCLLAPSEPEICVCQSNSKWKCLWWF